MAQKRSGAGSLNFQLTFQKRVEIDDGFGGTRGEWVDQFTAPARLVPKFGSNVESVMADRMLARQPYNATVRSSVSTRQVTSAWRAYDTRAGIVGGIPNRTFGIKTIVNPDERNAYLEMLVIENEAT